MNVALLCPGPSLSLLEAPPVADILIGVNRAANRFSCAWVAALDYPLIRDERKNFLGNPALFTRRQTWHDIRGKVDDFCAVVFAESLSPPVNKWDLKTASAALVFAAHVGATKIDVFGADWTVEEKDFDGVLTKGVDRSESRWQIESEIWNNLVEWLKGRGVEVNRISA